MYYRKDHDDHHYVCDTCFEKDQNRWETRNGIRIQKKPWCWSPYEGGVCCSECGRRCRDRRVEVPN